MIINTGDPATIYDETDRFAVTVVQVFKVVTRPHVIVQLDEAEFIGIVDSQQQWKHAVCPSGLKRTFRYNNKYQWEQVEFKSDTQRFVKSKESMHLLLGFKESFRQNATSKEPVSCHAY